jgi:small subunit ribosomal protein S11
MADETIIPPTPEAAAAPAAPAAPAPAAAPADKAAPAGGDKAVSQSVWLELEGGSGETPGAPKVIKAKGSKNVTAGIVHVIATFNNTIVTVTDRGGNVIGWSSSGKMGFRGSRKGTAYAAQVVSQDACRQAMGHGLREVEVRLRGPGSGREAAVRAVQALGIEVSTIKDVTPVPHNGCRPPRARRV